MAHIGTTLTTFVQQEQRLHPTARGTFTGLLTDIALACKKVASLVHRGALVDVIGRHGGSNNQGEAQEKLDVLADAIFRECLLRNGNTAALASEEHEHLIHPDPGQPRGPYLVAYDPLDGSSNIDVNVTVGSIISVRPAPVDRTPTLADFLQPGTSQVAAAYCLYGPSTQLVLTLGSGVHVFTLDPDIGEFILTRTNAQIPAEAREFAINTSNRRRWDPAVRRWYDECLLGAEGPRGRDFNMRWIASLVAEVHRILTRGGVFTYPVDARLRAQGRTGRLRLLYELAPMALLVEQAGGAVSTGERRLMEVCPTSLHDRVPVFLGASTEVALIEAYHREAATSA